MIDKLSSLWIGAQLRMRNFWEDFKTEEKGAAEIVAIILVVVVIIALVAIFRDRIANVINSVFDKTDDFVNSCIIRIL